LTSISIPSSNHFSDPYCSGTSCEYLFNSGYWLFIDKVNSPFSRAGVYSYNNAALNNIRTVRYIAEAGLGVYSRDNTPTSYIIEKQPCAVSCNLCTGGPPPSLCTSCKTGGTLSNGVCSYSYTCTSPCSTCYGTSTSQCITCIAGYVYTGGLCQPCHSSCTSCSGTASNQCLTCQTGLTLSSGTCTLVCDSTCATCTGPAANQCSTCQSGWTLSAGTCSYTCDSTCATCTGPATNQCSTCATGWNLSAGTCSYTCDSTCATCMGPAANQCSTCQSGWILSAGTCSYTCDSTCVTCTGPAVNQCTTCQSGWTLASNSCSYVCHSTCDTCTGPAINQCSTCRTGWTFSAGTCTSTCDPSCASCSGPAPNECVSCQTGWTLSAGTCSYSCDSSCLTCIGPAISQCSSCKPTGTLSTGICTYPPAICQSPCETCDPSSPSACLSCIPLPSPLFLHIPTNTCSPCLTDSLFIDSTSACTSTPLVSPSTAVLYPVLTADTSNPYTQSPIEDDSTIELHFLVRLYPSQSQSITASILNSTSWNISATVFLIDSPTSPPSDTLGSAAVSNELSSHLSLYSDLVNGVIEIKVTIKDFYKDKQLKMNQYFRTQILIMPLGITVDSGNYQVLGVRRSFEYSTTGILKSTSDSDIAFSGATIVNVLTAGSLSGNQITSQSLFSVLSADPTGVLSSFTQSIRFVNRLLYLKFHFGTLLTHFLEECERGSGIPKVSQARERFTRSSFRYKLSSYSVDPSLAGFSVGWKTIIYCLSWLLHLTVLRIRALRMRLPIIGLYVVYFMPMFHLFALNLVMLDISFQPFRSFLHSRDIAQRALATIFIIMLSVDFMLLIHAVFKNDLWSLLLKIHFKNKEKIKLSPIEEGKPSLRKGSDNYPNSAKTNGREQHPPKEKLPAKKTILHTKENIDFNLTYNEIELAELRSLASVSLLTASAKSFENKLARAEHLLSLARTFLFNITLISNQVMASLPVIFLLAFEISLSVRGLVLYIRTRYINSIFVVALRQLQVWSQVIFILIVMWNQTAVGRTTENLVSPSKRPVFG
jgi:hypothetical protein